MTEEQLSVTLVDNDDDLLEVALLKQADDSEFLRMQLSQELALEKILRMKERGSDFWIAKINSQPVGYATGFVEGLSDNYRSMGIFVLPEYRRKGIGSKLKEAMVSFARELGCNRIWSTIRSLNEASIRMNEKAGASFSPLSYGGGYIVSAGLREK